MCKLFSPPHNINPYKQAFRISDDGAVCVEGVRFLFDELRVAVNDVMVHLSFVVPPPHVILLSQRRFLHRGEG